MDTSSHSFDRMKNLSVLLAVLVAGASGLRAQPIPLYENWGVVEFGETPPQIDALAFANYGTFNIFAGVPLVPYDFQNTRHYTNRGTMFAFPGFKFDTAFSLGQRVPALNFENHRGAFIEGGLLSVTADRIVSQGFLSAFADGMVFLKGRDVDLSRGTLSTGFGEGPFGTIFDWYWGGLTEGTFDSQGDWMSFNANDVLQLITPVHPVTNVLDGPALASQFQLTGPATIVFTNQLPDGSQVVQAGFVGYQSNTFSANLTVGQPSQETGLRPIFAQFVTITTNVLTGDPVWHTFYFADRLASSTNDMFAPFFRPETYEFQQTPPDGYFFGGPGNATFNIDMFINPAFVEDEVDMYWAAYGAFVELPSVAALPPLGTITNTAGRIQIDADVLDLNRTRISSSGLTEIRTRHLVGSDRTLIDAGRLIYQLASTNGNLTIQNLSALPKVGPGGSVRAWSAVWTNQVEEVTTEPGEDPEEPPVSTTNTVDTIFHVLLLNANNLSLVQQPPAPIFLMDARADNIVVRDNMTVDNEFHLDGLSVTLDSNIQLAGNVRSWTIDTAPRVMFFTNLGSLTIPNIANFGADRPAPYQMFVNRGTLSAATHIIHSEHLENSGTITAAGRISIQVGDAKFEGGTHNGGRDVFITGRNVKFHQYSGFSGGQLVLDVTDSLTDSGPGANAILNTADGLRLVRKPTNADLIGTTILSSVPRFGRVDHVWPASDFGPVPEGFQNNITLGSLILTAGSDDLFTFRGPDVTDAYAIYVDYLQLLGGVELAFRDGRLDDVLDIAPNFTIYYAYANVPVEELDGQLNGRFRWVKDFAGPNSSVDVALRSGKTIRVNRGLRESLTIDSNGNGLANGLDPWPFDEPELEVTVVRIDPFMTELRWVAAPQTAYVVEYASDFAGEDWVTLEIATNRSDLRQTMTVLDDTIDAQSHRYYRVRYSP
jgi:hypothetical protein